MNATTLPILDLAATRTPLKKRLLADLRHAARDIGFFYLINHGVDDALQQAFSSNPALFCPPDAQKKQRWR
jgi:isopenicillin N synthase-like dioxygenase